MLPLDNEFNVARANEMARLESYNKHHYRPNTYLHKWWARRCGTTFRLILKHLVENEAQRDYFAAGGLEGKVILDPMMGGGTTLHEAIRMGANVIGVDVDPIPVLQARASLSDVPLRALRPAFEALQNALRAALAPLFQTRCPICDGEATARFILYGLRRWCVCGVTISVDSLILREESQGGLVRLCPQCQQVYEAERCSCGETGDGVRVVVRAGQQCVHCEEEYREPDHPYYCRYQPIAIATGCGRHGLRFRAPSADDLRLIERADAKRAEAERFLNGDELPFAVCSGAKSDALLKRGVDSYLHLFSSRQLIYLATAIQMLPRFEPPVRLNLALLLSTSLEFNSMLCGYKGRGRRRPGAIRHTFSHHAYTFPHTALENNPVFSHRASGTLESLYKDRIERGRRWALRPWERRPNGRYTSRVRVPGETGYGREVAIAAPFNGPGKEFKLIQGTAASLPLDDNCVDYVVTDPPYFDSVQYGDLARFFRVWLQRMLPGAARWEYDLSQAAVVNQDHSAAAYRRTLSEIFAECHRVLRKESGRLIFTYHHWNPKGWAALTLALKQAGFLLVNRYVVHAEHPLSVHIANMRALTHDVILVLAPVEAGMRRDWERPAAIDHGHSERFCHDCGTLLGWLLNEERDPAAVEKIWLEALDY